MSTKYNASLFDSLKDSFSKNNNVDSAFKDFLKFETDKTYIVRLVPNVDDISNSWYEYKQHIFDSVVHGKKISVLCPNTYKEKCPICEYRTKIYATKNESLINQIRPLKKSEKWLYNAYVVSDPSNPSNQGQVKYLNAGSQLEKIIEAARFGDDKDEFGAKIFDLSSNGCNLKIKVEKNEGGYPSYVTSKFTSSSKIDALDSDSAIDAAYSAFKPYDNIFKPKTYNEVKELLDVHFLGKDSSTAATPAATQDEEDEFKIDSTPSVEEEVVTETSSTLSEQEKRMQDILNDL
jgi:hypothetical protein